MIKKIAPLCLVLLFMGGLLPSCKTKTTASTASITIDSTNAYLPVIKIKVNSTLKNLITKKTEWETIVGLFSINNNVVSPYAVTCNYNLQGDTLKLIPVLPLGNQLAFEVKVFTNNDTLKKRFTTPLYNTQQQKPAISGIYPLAPSIPTNILMFHITFATPMTEDELVFKDILILDDKGKEKQRVWREKASWTSDGKHLVLMVHPGRIKKGIKYMDDYGVLFEVGKKYTIVIPEHIKDSYGKPLGKEYRKTYTITAMDTIIPVYNSKNIVTKANTNNSISLKFSEPIDYGTAQLGIEIENGKNKKIEGKLEPNSDKAWTFTPTQNWQQGSYTIKLNDYVADLASNHLTRKFEMKHLDSMINREGLKFKFEAK